MKLELTEYQKALQALIDNGVDHLIDFTHGHIEMLLCQSEYHALMTEMVRHDMSFADGKATLFYDLNTQV